ncbi:hypothetical protein EGH24_05250 [Halonotius terrestris]|uniref:Uncharacterized protein n=1 Tax=Halonotius terrestris TaxID=2487750 RepID=A0A8J8TCX4_9EURY|nr:hypothetical protein [Halonotius terrestris]TQQ82848.1 hypothetical protein EGH24_05250 [Halonotius terrestris]
MTTKTEDRLLGLAVAALLTTAGGELLGISLLVAAGVTGFALALAGLFVVMPLSLLVGLSRISGPDMRDATVTERTH